MASHNADLAAGFGAQARDLLEKWGPTVFGRQVRADQRSISNWKLAGYDGAMECFGVGGGMLGKGADLMIIDDPISGRDAASPTVRESLYDWWLNTARNRLNPGGPKCVILMQQRLNVDDLAGRLLEKNPEDWEVCNLRAEAEEDDVLGRPLGGWLWPWGFTDAEYRQMKAENSYWWATQYQQRPVPRGGGMIQVDWIEGNAVHYAPREADARVRFWDRAATEGAGDWTVGVLMSRKGANYYVEDVVRERFGSTRRDALIKQTCLEDNARYPFGVTTWSEQEPGSAGKDVAIAFERMLSPYPAHCKVSTGSKELRADGLAGAFGRGEVHVYRGPRKGENWGWYEAYASELSTFPAGKHNDQVDATSGAFNQLALTDGDRDMGIYVPGSTPEEHAYSGEVTYL